MTFVVVYDANVLYGNTLRDLLIRIAQAGLVQAKWTHKILDEVLHTLRGLVNASVRDCLATRSTWMTGSCGPVCNRSWTHG